jgi:hypothetical protein
VELITSHSSGNKHFSDEQWADFVRGVAAEVVGRDMQVHLDSGCSVCRAAFQWLNIFARAALAEKEIEVPDRLVQEAREIFVASPARSHWTEAWEAISAELIQHVGLSWQPAGVRASAAMAASTGGRMLFRAGDYVVDLQLDPPSSGSGGEIVGQIANDRVQENLDGVIVEVIVPGRTVSETATNRFGEFVIEYSQNRNATLRFALAHRKQRIDLPLGLRG